MKKINLDKYIENGFSGERFPFLRGPSESFIEGYKTGQAAAREFGIKDMVDEEIHLVVSYEITHAVYSNFISGLLRPLIRRQGLDKTMKLVCSPNRRIHWALQNFEYYEEKKQQKQKQKEEWKPQWSDMHCVAVPDVGTTMKLVKDWKFVLYNERRNSSVCGPLGIPWDMYYFGTEPIGYEVILKAETILCVDRLFVRQNMSEFSSVTFTCKKGLPFKIVYNGTTYDLIDEKLRFWVKLHDFNNAVVNMDMNTLPH